MVVLAITSMSPKLIEKVPLYKIKIAPTKIAPAPYNFMRVVGSPIKCVKNKVKSISANKRREVFVPEVYKEPSEIKLYGTMIIQSAIMITYLYTRHCSSSRSVPLYALYRNAAIAANPTDIPANVIGGIETVACFTNTGKRPQSTAAIKPVITPIRSFVFIGAVYQYMDVRT